MQQPKIELAKTRDLGEAITDSFTFISQNFKPLFKSIFTFCGLFILASAATYALQQVKVMDLQKRIFDNKYETFSTMSDRFGIEYVLSMFFILLSYTLMSTTVISFMALYKQKGNIAPTTEEVWGYVKYFFLRVLLGVVVLTVLLVIATLLCLIPGVYVYPIFGLVFPIMVIENASFGYAFNQSFKIINNNWWSTFGALFVMGLIMYVAYLIFSIPNIIISVIGVLTHGRVTTSPILTVIGSLLQQMAQILYVLPLVTLVMCYFNLTEIKEGSGLIDRINQFGNHSPDNHLPAEEY
jgi:hypothetical protein